MKPEPVKSDVIADVMSMFMKLPPLIFSSMVALSESLSSRFTCGESPMISDGVVVRSSTLSAYLASSSGFVWTYDSDQWPPASTPASASPLATLSNFGCVLPSSLDTAQYAFRASSPPSGGDMCLATSEVVRSTACFHSFCCPIISTLVAPMPAVMRFPVPMKQMMKIGRNMMNSVSAVPASSRCSRIIARPPRSRRR